MRKEWGSPKSNVQVFTPQEFVANCEKATNVSNISGHEDYLRIDIDGNGHYGTQAVADPEFGGNAFSASPSSFTIGENGYELVNINVYRFIGTQGYAYESNMNYLDTNNFRLIATQVIRHWWSGKYHYYLYKPASSATGADSSYFPTITEGVNHS